MPLLLLPIMLLLLLLLRIPGFLKPWLPLTESLLLRPASLLVAVASAVVAFVAVYTTAAFTLSNIAAALITSTVAFVVC